jgi:SAM-dependent methyltransferase
MHPSAAKFAKLFFDQYLPVLPLEEGHSPMTRRVLEVGAGSDGTFRELAQNRLEYIPIDRAQSEDPNTPYRFDYADESIDIIVCSSVFEHDIFFWVTFLECMRVLKPQGLLYLQAPSNGPDHKYPVDCWRFYPDSGKALEKWARYNNYRPLLLETFINATCEESNGWRDWVSVYVRDELHENLYPERIINLHSARWDGWEK